MIFKQDGFMQQAQEIRSYSVKKPDPFAELESGVLAALETYSNVHRGSGHNSLVTTHLYEQARNIVLDYLGLSKKKYEVIFCSPLRAEILAKKINPDSFQTVSSQDIYLPLGVRAIAVKRGSLPGGTPFQTGGGTTRIISPDWVVWANAPDKFEAGTPQIMNVIIFARALTMVKHLGPDTFRNGATGKISVSDILYRDELEEYSGLKLLQELRKTLIGHDILVPTTEGIKPYINLDNAASTPTFRPIWNAVCKSLHYSGQEQAELVQETRSICAGFLDAPVSDYDIVFTSNTTEAINLVAASLSKKSEHDTEPVVLTTVLEHTSNDLPWRMVPGVSIVRLQIDAEGFVDLNKLEAILCDYNSKCRYGKKRIRLMAVTGASNVLGVFNNLEDISRIVHKYKVLLMVDAAQLVAHRKTSVRQFGIDFLAFSAHKVYAPFGTGVLVAGKGLLNFNTDEMELIRKSGEENLAGIASLGKALVLLKRIGLNLIRDEEQALTRRTLLGLAKIPEIIVYGVKDPSAPGFERKGGVIAFSHKKIFSDKIAGNLADQGGIGIRHGCHCAHILVKQLVGVGPFLERFQRIIATLFPVLKFPGLARVSFGIGNTGEDIDIFIKELNKIVRRPGSFRKTNIRQQMDDFVNSSAQKVYT